MPPEPGRPTRLTVFLADLQGGGAERMMVVIANGMAARGMDVDLVLADVSGPYVKEVADAVRVVDLGTGSVSRALLPLARHLRRRRPDVMLTTLAHTSFVAVLARAAAGVRVPTVVREANTPQAAYPGWVSGRTLLAHRLAPLTYRGADGVIAVSDGVKDALVTVLGVPEGKVATLYNPVVAPELKRLAREDPCHPWFAAGEPPVVLGVGSLTPRKDFATLVRAFARLERPDARLVILGEGEERAALQALVAELGLTGRVDLPGFAQNPFAFMSRAAVFVLSSTLEGLPGALVQALACGCPAVATDCPSGPREVLRDGAVGPLVPVGDVDAMAAAIARVLDDPPDRAALPAAVERYDAGSVLDATCAYLEGMASRGRRPRRPA
ncbi:MAG TPA: glycosyltransferase [Trueperaceae bacterium]|nr:glycosyltransferase [Trueperaceae bacterium]